MAGSTWGWVSTPAINGGEEEIMMAQDGSVPHIKREHRRESQTPLPSPGVRVSDSGREVSQA